ncbi:MAG: DUF4382 domain-containing protein [Proteobacteria bacterium]|nr:MAG: DUF4382 domain-containing protein [Pseudomonadota bacterium]
MKRSALVKVIKSIKLTFSSFPSRSNAMKRFSPVCLGFLFSLSILDGCGGTLGGNPESDGTQEETGKALSFVITDAPIEDAKHVYITVASVSLLQGDGEWLNIPMDTATEIDLLHYQDGLTSPLASISKLATGTYSQTRLVLSETQPARLVDMSGIEHSLKIPSGSESGLKINAPVVVEAGIPKAMVIDFDLRKSIKSTGNSEGSKTKYMMKPVLRMVDVKESGGLEGVGTNKDIVCLFATDTAMDMTDDCDSAVASGTVKESKVKLSFINPGTYNLRVFRNNQVFRDISSIKVDANALTSVERL